MAGTGRIVRIEGKTCSRALRTSDRGEDSPSNRTIILNTDNAEVAL
jgi:hypothetical protein